MPRLKSWLKELHEFLPEDLPVWLVGNKLDIAVEKTHRINYIVKKFAKRQGYGFHMTSAKCNERGLIQMFDQIATKLWPGLK